MIVLGIPTLRCFDCLVTCVASALTGTIAPDQILVIDNSGGHCPPVPGARIVPGRQPQGVARAWNDLMTLAGGADVILSNDDITFAPNTIERLLTVAAARPRAGIISPIEGQRFALFWLRRAAYQDVGSFDEQFSPAYFEDNDYHRRLTLAGWESPVAPSAVGHIVSATMKAATPEDRERHHALFRACRARYVRKWGGIPGQEKHERPCGGDCDDQP